MPSSPRTSDPSPRRVLTRPLRRVPPRRSGRGRRGGPRELPGGGPQRSPPRRLFRHRHFPVAGGAVWRRLTRGGTSRESESELPALPPRPRPRGHVLDPSSPQRSSRRVPGVASVPSSRGPCSAPGSGSSAADGAPAAGTRAGPSSSEPVSPRPRSGPRRRPLPLGAARVRRPPERRILSRRLPACLAQTRPRSRRSLAQSMLPADPEAERARPRGCGPAGSLRRGAAAWGR